MPEYHRSWVPGGTYFFTVVTYQRHPILLSNEARDCLHAAWTSVRNRFPFSIDAVCLLPDHLHSIWTLPEGDSNYAVRWGEIKKTFTKLFTSKAEFGQDLSESRLRRGEAGVWQRRYWEHTIRDQADYYRHLDYIHYNPVKHGLVVKPGDYFWSSFHRYVKLGFYEDNWGSSIGEEILNLDCGE